MIQHFVGHLWRYSSSIQDASYFFNRCVFEDLYSNENGGAINIANASTISLAIVSFSRCFSGLRGGCAYLQSNTTNMTNVCIKTSSSLSTSMYSRSSNCIDSFVNYNVSLNHDCMMIIGGQHQIVTNLNSSKCTTGINVPTVAIYTSGPGSFALMKFHTAQECVTKYHLSYFNWEKTPTVSATLSSVNYINCASPALGFIKVQSATISHIVSKNLSGAPVFTFEGTISATVSDIVADVAVASSGYTYCANPDLIEYESAVQCLTVQFTTAKKTSTKGIFFMSTLIFACI